MCNGANLAFRKDVFNEVSGYKGNIQIASGDDEFLMRKSTWKISFWNTIPLIFMKGLCLRIHRRH